MDYICEHIEVFLVKKIQHGKIQSLVTKLKQAAQNVLSDISFCLQRKTRRCIFILTTKRDRFSVQIPCYPQSAVRKTIRSLEVAYCCRKRKHDKDSLEQQQMKNVKQKLNRFLLI
jgi:hypothetical protein